VKFNSMKILIITLCVLFVVLLVPNNGFAQDVGDRLGVEMVSRHSNDEVWLRWAPRDALGWMMSNRHGWWLQRVMLPLGDQPGDSTYTFISSQPIRPMPLHQWEEAVHASDVAALAAELLYGEILDISLDANMILNKNTESRMRFSFALSVADADFKVAQMMGLGFIDKDVMAGRSYIYRVFANSPDTLMVADTTGVAVILSRPFELPVAFGLEAQVSDSIINFKWPAAYHRGYFSAYNLEINMGSGWQRLSSLPLVQIINEGDDDFFNYYRHIYRGEGDTLLFRLMGITPFGDFGPPGEELSVIMPLAIPTPQLMGYTEPQPGHLGLKWEFPAGFEAKITEFDVVSSTTFNGQLKVLGKYASTARAAMIRVDGSEFYLAIRVHGKDGTIRSDFPVLVQLHDSIPPAPPVELMGEIDIDGQVRIAWQRGKESDLMGYRVYASARSDAELTLISADFVRDTVFYWHQPLNTLSQFLYVSIMAYDFRYNYSGFSDMLKLAIPDTIPPAAPVLIRCAQEGEGVKFEWIPSASPDVAYHAIMYAAPGEKMEPQPIARVDDKGLNHFLWLQPEAGQWRFYVAAVDHSGNSALSQQHFHLKIEAHVLDQLVPRLTVKANHQQGHILLQWQVPLPGMQTIIYRSINNEVPQIYKTLLTHSFEDKDVQIGLTYNYWIRFRNEFGILTDLSTQVNITF
jgi:uncharacterized protein